MSINTILFNKSYNFIDRFFIICSTYFFDNCTSQNIYLIVRQLFQRLHEYYTHYNSRKILKYTRLQTKLTCFFSISFETIHRFVRSHLHLSIYLFNNFQKSFEHSFLSQFEIFDENVHVCTSNRFVFSFFVQKISISISIRSSWISLRNRFQKQLLIDRSWLFLHRNFWTYTRRN